MRTVHHILQLKRRSYPILQALIRSGQLKVNPKLRLQHDRASGLLYEAKPELLEALSDSTLLYGDITLHTELHRLPSSEYSALVRQSPRFRQHLELDELSVALRSPTLSVTEAARLLESAVAQEPQPDAQPRLVQPDGLFSAVWDRERLVLQRSGDDWFLVLFFQVQATQPDLFTHRLEVSLDLGSKPLVYASTSEERAHRTQPCETDLIWQVRSRLSPQARRLLDRIVFSWHQAQLQRVSDFLCRHAFYVYAEDLRYKDMKPTFVQRSRRNGVLDFHECWMHTRLQLASIGLEKVDPRHTSLRCSYCPDHPFGHRDGDVFFCPTCRRRMNAHRNATRNIMRLGQVKALRWRPAV